jgi:hypothetical protein
MNYPAAETAGYQKVESMLSVVIPTLVPAMSGISSESFFKKDSGQALNRMVQGKPE